MGGVLIDHSIVVKTDRLVSFTKRAIFGKTRDCGVHSQMLRVYTRSLPSSPRFKVGGRSTGKSILMLLSCDFTSYFNSRICAEYGLAPTR